MREQQKLCRCSSTSESAVEMWSEQVELRAARRAAVSHGVGCWGWSDTALLQGRRHGWDALLPGSDEHTLPLIE